MITTMLATNLSFALTALLIAESRRTDIPVRPRSDKNVRPTRFDDGAEDKAPATEKLIEQLGSKKYAERERARQLLEARGPSVLPFEFRDVPLP